MLILRLEIIFCFVIPMYAHIYARGNFVSLAQGTGFPVMELKVMETDHGKGLENKYNVYKPYCSAFSKLTCCR